MPVLLALSYTSAASSTFLWPSAPLTTTAFTPARRIRRGESMAELVPAANLDSDRCRCRMQESAADVAGIDSRPCTGLEHPLPTVPQRTNAPNEVSVDHRVQREQLLLLQHLHFAFINHPPDVQHVFSSRACGCNPVASSMRRPSEATNRTIVEYGSFNRSTMARVCSGFNSVRTTARPPTFLGRRMPSSQPLGCRM